MKCLSLLIVSWVVLTPGTALGEEEEEEIECSKPEYGETEEESTVCDALEAGSGQQQCGYFGDRKKDLPVVFNKIRQAAKKLHPTTDLDKVKLEYWEDEESHSKKCGGSDASASVNNDYKPDKITICRSLWKVTRNIDQIGFVVGHEFSHFIFEHHKNHDAAFEKMKKAWEKSKGPKYLRTTSKEDKKKDMEKRLCPRLNRLYRGGEKQADANGLLLMREAGFKAKEAAKAWWQERDWHAIAFGADGKLVFRYGRQVAESHPTDLQRAREMQKRAKELAQ